MKTFNKIIWFKAVLIAITMTILPSCKKTTLPEETQSGAMTFGCRVNGKAITASGKYGILADDFVSCSYSTSFGDSTINIRATSASYAQAYDFTITIRYENRIGIYIASSRPYYGYYYDQRGGSASQMSYSTNASNTATVNLTKFNPLSGDRICAGTFTMNAVSDNGKIVRITDGRFDMKY